MLNCLCTNYFFFDLFESFAGVDFSVKDHFDDMFVVACHLSTTPSGLFQMTWRVRKLKNPHVFCYAQDSIRLGPGGQPKALVKDCLEHLKHVSEKAFSFSSEHEFVTLSNGEEIFVPKVTPLMLISAHNDAVKLNSQGRFFMEFEDIANSQGHQVSYRKSQVTDKNNSPTKQSLHVKADHLINSSIIDDDTFAEIDQRVRNNTASEDDKWKHYKYLYMKGWGIKHIDKNFVDSFGTAVTSVKIKSCMQFIFKKPFLYDWEDPIDQKYIVQHTFLKEVLKALGWDHPFHINKEIDEESLKARLPGTKMYKDFNKNIRVFSERVETRFEWTPKKIKDSLDIILGSIGLSVCSKATQKQIKGQRDRSYSYSIDKKQAAITASLINLRNRFQSTPLQHSITPFLAEVQFGNLIAYA